MKHVFQFDGPQSRPNVGSGNEHTIICVKHTDTHMHQINCPGEFMGVIATMPLIISDVPETDGDEVSDKTGNLLPL